jgi:hypothetical protein
MNFNNPINGRLITNGIFIFDGVNEGQKRTENKGGENAKKEILRVNGHKVGRGENALKKFIH